MPSANKLSLGSALTLALIGACDSAATGSTSKPGPQDSPRITIRLEGAGGQTGTEGGCVGSELRALPFGFEDVQRLVGGRHETTLADRAFPTAAAGGAAMTVSVAFRGEASEDLGCGGSLRVPVTLTLSFMEPALDLVIDETLTAFTADTAVLQAALSPEVGEQLALRSLGGEARKSNLNMWFGSDGVRGAIQTSGRCQNIVFPSDRRCIEHGGIPLALDTELNAVLARVAELRDVPTHNLLEGAETSVTISPVGEPREICSGSWPTPRSPGNPARVGFNSHIQSADGRVDVTLPGELEYAEATAMERAWWVVRFKAVLPAETLNGVPQRALADPGQLLSFSLNIFEASAANEKRGELVLRAIASHAAAPSVSEPVTDVPDHCYGTVSGPLGGPSTD